MNLTQAWLNTVQHLALGHPPTQDPRHVVYKPLYDPNVRQRP